MAPREVYPNRADHVEARRKPWRRLRRRRGDLRVDLHVVSTKPASRPGTGEAGEDEAAEGGGGFVDGAAMLFATSADPTSNTANEDAGAGPSAGARGARRRSEGSWCPDRRARERPLRRHRPAARCECLFPATSDDPASSAQTVAEDAGAHPGPKGPTMQPPSSPSSSLRSGRSGQLLSPLWPGWCGATPAFTGAAPPFDP